MKETTHISSPPRVSASEQDAAPEHARLTHLLRAIEQGDSSASERLFVMIYQQLRTMARRRMRVSGGNLTLNPTGLVHETYLRLIGAKTDIHNSRHFFSIAARAMRQIVVDMARRRNSAKRGGGQRRLTIESSELAVEDQAAQLCELNQHLEKLACTDSRLVQVIECRFFGGLSEPETAKALAISVSTVQRDWIRAKAWFAANASAQSHGTEDV